MGKRDEKTGTGQEGRGRADADTSNARTPETGLLCGTPGRCPPFTSDAASGGSRSGEGK